MSEKSCVLPGRTNRLALSLVLAFGFSWFLKGSELFNILRAEHRLPPMLRRPDPNEPAAANQAPATDTNTNNEGLR